MQQKTMNKESKRITSAIKKAETPSFVGQVNVEDLAAFNTIVQQVAEQAGDTFVMLGAIAGRSLYVGAIIPPKPENEKLRGVWLNASLNESPDPTDEWIQVRDVVFPETSEQTPFKAIDQVLSTAANFLRKSGAIPEEEEEHEYGFDDIGE